MENGQEKKQSVNQEVKYLALIIYYFDTLIHIITPLLKEHSCPLPNQTSNTMFEINSLFVGSIAHYHCPLGFEITKGDSNRTCLPDQTWSGVEPVCTRNKVNLF